MKKPDTVFVRNNGTEDFQNRFDGEDFEIPAGGVCEMLAECATLCLGFGEENKARVIARNGWSLQKKDETAQESYERAIARLNSFSFHMSEEEALNVHLSAPVGGGDAAAAEQSAAVAPAPKKGSGPIDKLANATAAAG